MVEYDNDRIVTDVLKSLSDATRRSLLLRLCQEGPCRITELASSYDMSLNAISKHIKVLERSELIVRKTVGRTHWIEANPVRIEIIEAWFRKLKSIWELRVDKLAKLLETEVSNDRISS